MDDLSINDPRGKYIKNKSIFTYIIFLVTASLLIACGPQTGLTAEPSVAGTRAVPFITASSIGMTYSLGHFPEVPEGSLSDSIASALQAILDEAVKDGLPGISSTVLVAGGGAWSGVSGTADGVNSLQIRSQFGIASITKTVIAAEIMWLAEQGLLRLSDTVSGHLSPSFQFDSNGATIQNLLHMESGIPDPVLTLNSGIIFANPQRWTPEEILTFVSPQRGKPGDHFRYEDANYMLLGLVIKETTGMNVSAALRAHILADPRLSSLVYQPEERPEGPLAFPFNGKQVGANFLEESGGDLPSELGASQVNGSGCMASDSPALALWGYLLFGRDLITEQSLLAMTDFGKDISQGGIGPYGLGVIDQTNLAGGFGVKAIGNGGWDDGGYSSELTILPSEGIVISIMTNTGGDPKVLVMPIAQKLVSILQR